ncbi:MAG TPA: cyclic nucleotide-binding domain-containing protein [Acidimicrobiia bacterium]|nr:cyclic nucleotide-binding domain-containing protein [Acidimicrobiia bacterium]
MRVESSVTSVSWIPSEAVTGPVLKGTFEVGFTHYDDPPPDEIDDLEEMRVEGRFRFANHLAAWVEVEGGRIVDAGYSGGGLMGSTSVRLANLRTTFEPVPLPDIRHEPEVSDAVARFVQTTGGRTGLPAPRRVKHPPFIQFKAPTVWTTLALTIRADGTSEFEVLGASKFPRHWVYDDEGQLAAKVGLADFKEWYRDAFGRHTPWGDRDSKALVTAVETALERELSVRIMRKDARPEIRTIKKGTFLVQQGQPGDELFLLLDGVLKVIVDGEPVAEIGPGAILGERAVLEGGKRTSTLESVTACRVAVARADDIDRAALEQLAAGHRREPPSKRSAPEE